MHGRMDQSYSISSARRLNVLDIDTTDNIEASMQVASISKIIEVLVYFILETVPTTRIIQIKLDLIGFCIEISFDGKRMSNEVFESIGLGSRDIDKIKSLAKLHFQITQMNIITIYDIFYRYYARRMSLQEDIEISHIWERLCYILLPYPMIQLTVTSVTSIKCNKQISRHSTVLERFVSLHGVHSELIPISVTRRGYTIEGYLTLPTAGYRDASSMGQYAYVNSKYHSALVATCQGVYESFNTNKSNLNTRRHYDRSKLNANASFILLVSSTLHHFELDHDTRIEIYQIIVSFIESYKPTSEDSVQQVHQASSGIQPYRINSYRSLSSSQNSDMACFDILSTNSFSHGTNEESESVERELLLPLVQQLESPTESTLSMTVRRQVSETIPYFDQLFFSAENTIRPYASDDCDTTQLAAKNVDYAHNEVSEDTSGGQYYSLPSEEYHQQQPLQQSDPYTSHDIDELLFQDDSDHDFKVSRKQDLRHSLLPAQSIQKLDKLQLADLSAIGQCDRKFVFALLHDRQDTSSLLCFDQHAVDERIRLESFGTIDLAYIQKHGRYQPLMEELQIPVDLYSIVESHRPFLESWGFRWQVLVTSGAPILRVLQVPVIQNEPMTGSDLIEFLEFIQSSHSFLPLTAMRPPALARILASKACRSAIKFGDNLSSGECENLLYALKTTNFPFQCAHGRPTVTPLLDMKAIHAARRKKFGL